MQLTRRDFLRASSALSAAFGLRMALDPSEAEAAANSPPVVWLQAQSCSGCSVSLLNTIYYVDAADLLTKTVSMRYHSTAMAAAGANAVAAAQAALNRKGYVLVVEGAIPTGSQASACYLWPGLTAMQGVQNFARNAAFVIAAGSCSSFGGIPAALPNPTSVRPLSAIVGTSKLINLPGCPMHPDWLVGTVAYLLRYGAAPALDSLRRPRSFYPIIIHERCPYKEDKEGKRIGFGRCLEDYGCKGKKTVCDCAQRKWNGSAANMPGVSFCMFAGTPCLGCTDPSFPDGTSPFHAEADGDAVRQPATPQGDSTEAADEDHHAAPKSSTSPADKKPATYQERQLEKRLQYEKRKKELRRAYERSKLGLDK